MNTHEYQAKNILKKHGISIPDFVVISDIREVEGAIEKLNLNQAVVKVQVHAGGRGKAGGVKLAKNKKEIIAYSKELLGMKVVNEQTGKEGLVSNQILLSPLINYRKEFYMGVVVDRHNAGAVFMASPDGGVNIEEVAEKAPERILKMPIPLNGKFRSYKLFEIAEFMGWEGETLKQGMNIANKLTTAFVETDATLLEINPLVETMEGDLIALDAKLNIDSSALYRQKEISKFYDPKQLNKNEVIAKEHDLTYVALDGNIGCMVNGAGLAMATMDMLFLHGCRPANFLDVGGSADKNKIAEGFKILLKDKRLNLILVNIFGGIMNCVTLAAGIITAASEQEVKIPIVVRMEGTNVELGRKMLKDSGLNIITAVDFSDTVSKSCPLVKEKCF